MTKFFLVVVVFFVFSLFCNKPHKCKLLGMSMKDSPIGAHFKIQTHLGHLFTGDGTFLGKNCDSHLNVHPR